MTPRRVLPAHLLCLDDFDGLGVGGFRLAGLDRSRAEEESRAPEREQPDLDEAFGPFHADSFRYPEFGASIEYASLGLWQGE